MKRMVALIIVLTISSVCAQSPLWQGKGRIVLSSDGNEHDNDDWSASALSLALLAASGLQDRVVLYTYSDHVWGSNLEWGTTKEGLNAYEHMRESVLSSKQAFGFDKTNFICAVDNPEKAYNAMAATINASSVDNPLFIVAAGPMQVIGEGIKRALPEKRQHVPLITHSGWNNNHSDRPYTSGNRPYREPHHSGWTFKEIRESFSSPEGGSLTCRHILDQNGGSDYEGIRAPVKRFDWIKTSDARHSSPYRKGAWDWLYGRLSTCIKDHELNWYGEPEWSKVEKKAFDASDAGMVVYLLTGIEKTNVDMVRDIMENPVDRKVIRAVGRPNIIAILTDDQGWGDLSIHGNPLLNTPNIDRLALAGAQFDRFYVSPVCSPTRAEFLTGRHHVRCGVYETSEGGERVNPDETMIGELFHRVGYKTAAFGKWHSGMQYPYHPNARGFDEFYGFCSGHWGNYFSPMLEHNNEMVQGKGFVIDDFTERAMDYMEQHQDQPFFIYLPYNTPHSPMQVPDRWWKKFKDMELTQDFPKKGSEYVNHARAALAMCENIDWNVGRLLTKLDDLNLAHNTIVLYFCDNGPNGKRFNGGMRGRKGSTDEGGVRSPLFVRWPAKIKAGTMVPQVCSAMDLLPTLAEMAGIKVTGTKPLDGISFAPLLFGKAGNWQPRTFVHYWNGKLAVRTQQYRLDHQGRLYDIPQDPGQSTAINNKKPEVFKNLKRVADRFRNEMLANFGKAFDKRPFVIGHPEAKRTQIPARDGIGHGNIKRSNRWPNDSFFLNWTSLNDSITWDCEVGKTGRYKVELFYTCPRSDIGSTVELSFNRDKLVGKITEAHDPPLTGMEHDRFKRGESYVKDFKRMNLGTIRLQKGQGRLKLKALDIPGSQVMDFRLMLLTRMD